jgi:hypothetical protein
MDATRPRRHRDDARQRWYAYWRSVRFACHLGFASAPPVGQRLKALPWPASLPK